MSQVRVLFFASLRDAMGVAEIELAAERISDLWPGLEARFGPQVAQLRDDNVRIALNQTLLETLDAPLRAGDEVAFLPPVTGG